MSDANLIMHPHEELIRQKAAALAISTDEKGLNAMLIALLMDLTNKVDRVAMALESLPHNTPGAHPSLPVWTQNVG